MIRILSGTKKQADDLARMLEIGPYEFIDNIDRIKGLDRGTTICLYGDYQFRPDWKAMKIEMMCRNFKLLQVARKQKFQ